MFGVGFGVDVIGVIGFGVIRVIGVSGVIVVDVGLLGVGVFGVGFGGVVVKVGVISGLVCRCVFVCGHSVCVCA